MRKSIKIHVYRCIACNYYTQDPSNLKKIDCPTCDNPKTSYNYMCPACNCPLMKLKRKT